MFENLSEKLDKAFKVLKGQGSISEINVAQTMKEIRKALLSADVDNEVLVKSTATYIRMGDFTNVLIEKTDHFDLYGVVVN